jgi:protein-disulfide isomerase
MYDQPRPSAALPFAIIVGFGFIALAIYFSGIGTKPSAGLPQEQPIPTITTAVRPLDDTDFVRGNPNAPIIIIEYSDYDCPFCKVFHETMNRIMAEFGASGRVAWVYRQWPAAELHPNAPKLSEAAYCVGELGGTNAFWTFSDLIFSERELNETTNMTRLGDFATRAGVDVDEFDRCLRSGRMAERVARSVEEGIAAGVPGTPHSFLLVGTQQATIEGAQDYETVRDIILNLLAQLEGTTATSGTN